jgi:exo-beta-1,3-glucanase (GH17 family)
VTVEKGRWHYDISLSIDERRSLHHTGNVLNTYSRNPIPKMFSLAIVMLALGLGSTLFWWQKQGESHILPHWTGQLLPCVSYAPFRRPGASPFNVGQTVSAQEIEEDLRIIKKISSCVRTYGVSAGLELVPEVVKKLGMRLRLGAWLSANAIENRRELDLAMALTHRYSDVIDVLIVGNEVLLRKDLSAKELSSYLVSARKGSAVPISYADVWEFWRANAVLGQYVDTIAIHVLPYWEDEPVAAAQAVDHVFDKLSLMKNVFGEKPIWIGETGWPAAGRQREAAVPSAIEQIKFVRTLALRAAREKIDINFIEAFDQPWKRFLEGAMGGAWGLFDSQGRERFLSQGEFVKDVQWYRGWVASGMGIALGAVACFFVALTFPQRLFLLLAGGLLGAVIPLQFDYVYLWARNSVEHIQGYGAMVLADLGSIALAAILVGKHRPTFQWARTALLFLAATTGVILLFDARYRGFPLALYFLPAVLNACVSLGRNRIVISNQQIYLSMVLAATSIAMLVMEGLQNTQALALFAFWFFMSVPGLLALLDSRTSMKPARMIASAEGSGR